METHTVLQKRQAPWANHGTKTYATERFWNEMVVVLDHSSTKIDRERIRDLPFSYNCVTLGTQKGTKITPRGENSVVVWVQMGHQDRPRGRKSVAVLVKMIP